MSFLSVLIIVVSLVTCAQCGAELDKTMAALDVAQLTECRAGFKGEFPKAFIEAVSDCRKRELTEKGSDSCHTLCLWNKSGYFDRDASGKVTGLNKAAVETCAKELYSNPDSVSGKVNDLMSCYESVKPTPSFKIEGKCEDFAPMNKCYKEKMLTACLAHLKTTNDFN